MRQSLLSIPFLILPSLLAAGQAAAEHDRHHRSVPRVKAEVRMETPASPVASAPTIQASAAADAPPFPNGPLAGRQSGWCCPRPLRDDVIPGGPEGREGDPDFPRKPAGFPSSPLRSGRE